MSSPRPAPALILAADHRARGVVAVENYQQYLHALNLAMPYCTGILATAQPLGDLISYGAVGLHHRSYLSLNRTGLAGSAFELDDRLVASVERAAAMGCSGVKHMTRIDLADPISADALVLLGEVIGEAAAMGLEALIEPLLWVDGAVARDTDSIVLAAVIAHDMGAPLLKVPVPDVPAGPERVDAVARVVASVGVPVLFLGGARPPDAASAGDAGESSDSEDEAEPESPVLAMVRDAMAGGAAGMAMGRLIYQDPDPAGLARAVAAVLQGQ
jgi:DhnA family fructose-bisphosphate aldolase class Ia